MHLANHSWYRIVLRQLKYLSFLAIFLKGLKIPYGLASSKCLSLNDVAYTLSSFSLNLTLLYASLFLTAA